MIKKPSDDIQDFNLRSHIEFLQENTQGNALELSAAPTATEPLLEDKEVGQYGNDLYFRVGNTIYKLSSDEQITVS